MHLTGAGQGLRFFTGSHVVACVNLERETTTVSEQFDRALSSL